MDASDYYISTKKKVGDFFVGFLGTLVIAAILAWLSSCCRSNMVGTVWAAGGAAWIVGVIIVFTAGRRFIGIGALCTLLVPLLAVGACFVALFTGGLKL